MSKSESNANADKGANLHDRKREAVYISELSDDQVQAILTAELPLEAEALNDLMYGSADRG